MNHDNTYNPFSLEGKTILVTGASSGIGRATAIECSRMGARVILNARNTERLKDTLSMLTGDEHIYVPADLTNKEDLENLVSELPGLDGAALCAGIMSLTPIQAISDTILSEIESVNLNSQILLTQRLLKKKKLNRPSSIVFISSAAGVYRVSVGNALYAATKAGLDAFMRSCALELAPKEIRVNSVNPSIIATEGVKSINLDDIDMQENLQRYPMKRYGTPEEVAHGIIFLLSSASSYITGTALKIDGGLTLS